MSRTNHQRRISYLIIILSYLVYGSIFSNESPWADGRHFRHARHIACPQRLKYIHSIQSFVFICFVV